jgi:hypothetical protein
MQSPDFPASLRLGAERKGPLTYSYKFTWHALSTYWKGYSSKRYMGAHLFTWSAPHVLGSRQPLNLPSVDASDIAGQR